MLFFWNVNPDHFPFTITENAMSLKGIIESDGSVEFGDKKMEVMIDDLDEEIPEPGKMEDEKWDESVRDLLLVMDEVDVCLDFGRKLSGDSGHRELMGGLSKNMERVRLRLDGIFERLNIVKIETVGTIFDSNLHVPVGIENVSGQPNHSITKEKLAGYTRNGKVIRHAKVIVAKNDSGDVAK